MKHGTIKTGGGSHIISAIYPQMGARPKVGLSRAKPFRGQKQRSKGGRR